MDKNNEEVLKIWMNILKKERIDKKKRKKRKFDGQEEVNKKKREKE